MKQDIKKRVLMCCIRIPSKSGKGDQILMYKRLKLLLEKNYLVDLIYMDINKKQTIDIDSEFLKLYPIKISYIESLLNLTIALFNKIPFQVMFFKSNSYKKVYKSLIKKRNYSFVHSCLIRNNENIFTSNIDTDIYIEAIDSMTLNFYRRLNSTKNFFFRMILKAEYIRLKNYEKEELNKKNVKKIFLVSPIDKAYFPERLSKDIPLGIYVNNFPIRKRISSNNIIFFGNLSYYPNVNAVHWFIINCWPTITQKLPNIKFMIVGSRPDRSIKKLATDNIIVTGRVPSINSYLNNASISIAPLFDGSGMQLKILESMSCGVPVVTTSIGFGGISPEARGFVSIHDDPKEFSDACVELILGKDKNIYAGHTSRQFIETNHCNEVVNNKFIEELQKS